MVHGVCLLGVVLYVTACAARPAHSSAPTPVASAISPGSGGDPPGDAPQDGTEKTTRETVVEKLPDGTTRTTIVTHVTSTRTVEAPPPPPRPADPWPADSLARYNVDLLNTYRTNAGREPLLYDAAISAFALDGSKQLAVDHAAHAHFIAKSKGAPGFGTHSAENQGDPSGVPPMDAEARASAKKQITLLLKLMFDEGPGGGHYENMLSPKYRRIGVGLDVIDGRFYLTNDFSD